MRVFRTRIQRAWLLWKMVQHWGFLSGTHLHVSWVCIVRELRWDVTIGGWTAGLIARHCWICVIGETRRGTIHTRRVRQRWRIVCFVWRNRVRRPVVVESSWVHYMKLSLWLFLVSSSSSPDKHDLHQARSEAHLSRSRCLGRKWYRAATFECVIDTSHCLSLQY